MTDPPTKQVDMILAKYPTLRSRLMTTLTQTRINNKSTGVSRKRRAVIRATTLITSSVRTTDKEEKLYRNKSQEEVHSMTK